MRKAAFALLYPLLLIGLTPILLQAEIGEKLVPCRMYLRDVGFQPQKWNYNFNLNEGAFKNFTNGKTIFNATISKNLAPVQQVYGNEITQQDGQHYVTPGRQIVYAGYYNAACDYIYLVWTNHYEFAGNPIYEIRLGIYDWITKDWNWSAGGSQPISMIQANSCNIDATVDSGWGIASFNQGQDESNPWYSEVAYISDQCPDYFVLDTDSLAGPPNMEGIITGLCGDLNAMETPYVWPKVDVDTTDEGYVITHVAATEAGTCSGQPANSIETMSLLYYRKVADLHDQPWTGTWEGPHFMDSSYVMSPIVRADKNSSDVYYAYLKPIYFYYGNQHYCPNGLGHYQMTNEVVFRISSNDGSPGSWSPEQYVTDYASGFEEGYTEPAAYDLSAMVDPNGAFHIVWSSANRNPENPCEVYYGGKLWHYDTYNDCISLVYDATHPSFFKEVYPQANTPSSIFGAWNIVVAKQNISWCDDKLYISFTRFGAHAEGDTATDYGHYDGCHRYANGDILVVASDMSGMMGIAWSDAVNLTDTYSEDCMPGDCFNEHWSTMAMFSNDSLMIEYIEDKDPGAWCLGDYEATKTDNPVMFMTWPCFTMSEMGLNYCYESIPSSTTWPEIGLAPNGNTTGCTTPANFIDTVVIYNCGNADLLYTYSSPSPWLIVLDGGTGNIPAGTGPNGSDSPSWGFVHPEAAIGCASPATIIWEANSSSLGAGNYKDSVLIDFTESSLEDFYIVANVVVACDYFLPEYATITSGCWIVDVFNTPSAGNTSERDSIGDTSPGNMQFYACGGDSSIHPLYKESFIVGWNDGTIKCYSDLHHKDAGYEYRATDSVIAYEVGNPSFGQGYYGTQGYFCTPDSGVHGKAEFFVPGHQDTTVLIEKISVWNESGSPLTGFVAGEGIDWDCRSDSTSDASGIFYIDGTPVIFQRGDGESTDSIVAGCYPYAGHDANYGAASLSNDPWIYENNGYNPDDIYNKLANLDGTIEIFTDSICDQNTVLRFYEGTLNTTDTLVFYKIKAVSAFGVTALADWIEKGRIFASQYPGIVGSDNVIESDQTDVELNYSAKAGETYLTVSSAVPIWVVATPDDGGLSWLQVDGGTNPVAFITDYTLTIGYDPVVASGLTLPVSGTITLSSACAATDLIINVTLTEVTCQGICGDANNDSSGPDVSDAVHIINYVFAGGNPPIPNLACGDANSDAHVNVADAYFIILFVFFGGCSPGDCAPGSWAGGDCCPYSTEECCFGIDPGELDTLGVADGMVYSSPSDPVIFGVPVSLYNDIDAWACSFGLYYDSDDITADSISIVDAKISSNGSCSLHNDSNFVVIGYNSGFYYPEIPDGDSLLATIWFTLDADAPSQAITIDSGYYPPAGDFILVDDDGCAYTPQFKSGTITVSAPSGDSVTYDPVLKICPQGDEPFRVYIMDALGEPVEGDSSIFLVMEFCDDYEHCPGSTAGDTIFPSAPTDANGAMPFYVSGGGCDNDCVAHIYNNTRYFGTVPVKMLDIDGDFAVSVYGDFDYTLCNDYNGNGTIDFEDQEEYYDHLGHFCGYDPCQRFNSHFNIYPDTTLMIGVQVALELVLENNNFEDCYIGLISFFKKDDYGTGGDDILIETVPYNNTLSPGEVDSIQITDIVDSNYGSIYVQYLTDCCDSTIRHSANLDIYKTKTCDYGENRCYYFRILIDEVPTNYYKMYYDLQPDWYLDSIYEPSLPILTTIQSHSIFALPILLIGV